MSDTDVTSTLQAKWYNTVTSALGLSQKTFQLLQPSAPLGDTSDQLWSYFNNLPPASVNSFFASGGNRLYDDYRAVLSQLNSQNDGTFRPVLADKYQAWIDYVTKLSPLPKPQDLPETFRSWAYVYAPDKAQAGATALANGLNDPIFLANMAVQNQTKFLNNTPDWSKTIDDLRDAIPGAEGRSIDFDSNTASSDISTSWANGKVEGFYDIFTGDAGSSYSSLSSKVTASSLTVKGSFAHALTFSADPGSWYNSGALGAAYHTNDNTMWRHGTPSWESTFGPNGNMLWFTASLVVVDGIDLTITSTAQLSTEEQEEFKANLSVGIWPFFSLGASGGYSHDVSFDSNGSATVRIVNPQGNPVVLGANVLDVASFLTGGGHLEGRQGRTLFASAPKASDALGAMLVVNGVPAQSEMNFPARAGGYVLRISKQQWNHPVTYAIRSAAGATLAAGRVVAGQADSGDILIPANTAFTVFNVGVWPLTVTHP